MNGEKINNSTKKLRILVAPLDWGLGHATRCIPIIQTLLKHNTDVILAANGSLKILFELEFPQVKILDLKGYNITYTKHKNLFFLKLVSQLPKVFSGLRDERRWLERIVVEEQIDAVISDNRPGLHHMHVPCVYITHQLQIQTGNKLTNTWLRDLHYKYINKFQQCWIPDYAKGQTLAGKLSHPATFPAITYKYLGLLSRFNKKPLPILYDFLLLVSGPEPQRSIFEKKLLQVFDNSVYTFALVRGLPSGGGSEPLQTSAAKVADHLNANELNELILQSKVIVARAGYSTVMDLATLQKKAVLIPTPGQTEQEYLAKYLAGEKIFASLQQDDITLANIEKIAAQQEISVPEYDTSMYADVIAEWLASLRQPAI